MSQYARPYPCGLSSVQDLGVTLWIRNVHPGCEGIVDGCLPEAAPYFDPQGGRCGGVTLPDPPPTPDPDPPPPDPPANAEQVEWTYRIYQGVVEWWVRLTDQDGVETEIKTDYLRRSTGQVRTTTRGNR